MASQREQRRELRQQLSGLPFPMTAEDLMAVGQRLLLPSGILWQLGRLPLHKRFTSPDDVCDYVARGGAPAVGWA